MIRVEGLCKHYGEHVAVRGLSFRVARGETVALVGPNGAGKTTTLKCLLGLVRPTSGTIQLGRGGFSPDQPETRRSMGYVPQKVEFPRSQDVGGVLRFFSRLKGLPESSVAEVVERTALGPIVKRLAGELSGGMTQRLSLAQALLGQPEVLVLDEPTASLDPEATHEFRELIQTLKLEGKTILLCSHLLSEVERVADRALVMVEGTAAATLSMKELGAGHSEPSLEERFLEAVRRSRGEAMS